MKLGIATTMLAAAFIAFVSPAAWAADSRSEIGTVGQIQGDANARYESVVRPLKADDPIYLDDRLTTEAGARLRVSLTDQTEITLGENAELVVDRFVYDPDADAGSLVLTSLKGVFLFTGGLVEGLSGANVKIVTPVATLGIRGTTAWGGLIDGHYGVLVLDGTVTVTTEAGQVTLGAGLGTSIQGPASAPGAPQRWSPEKTARAFATVEFND